MSTLIEIESGAQRLSKAREELAQRLAALRDEQDAARRRRLQGIRNSVERYKTEHAELLAAVTSSPELFDKPKSRVLHGIKVGFAKQPGKLEIADVDATVAAIRKLFPEQAATLIRQTEAPVKDALQQLPAKDLKRLGVNVVESSDKAFIKAAADDLEKLLAALLAGVEDEETVDG